jgi:hypothetical protein
MNFLFLLSLNSIFRSKPWVCSLLKYFRRVGSGGKEDHFEAFHTNQNVDAKIYSLLMTAYPMRCILLL